MKNEVYFGIAFRLIILFGVAIASTYVPEHLRDFFGDTSCAGKTYKSFGEVYQGCPSSGFGFDKDWQWGTRHYWYAWLMFLLFLLSLANLVISVVNLITKHYEIKL